MDKSTHEGFYCENIVEKYNCMYCGFTTHLWLSLNDHIWSHHNSLENSRTNSFEIKQYVCEICSFKSYSLLVCHTHGGACTYILDISEEYFEKTNIKADLRAHDKLGPTFTEEFTSERCFNCTLCKYKTKHGHRIKLHTLNRHSYPKIRIKYECSQCFFESMYRQTLKRHVLKKHTNYEQIKWFKCDHCGYKAKLEYSLRKHMTTKHTQLRYECDRCSFRTAHRDSLRLHTITHHVDLGKIKWFECSQCEYKAKIRNSLSAHIKAKHSLENEVSHRCTKCSYKSAFERALKNHMIARHTDPKDIKWFECDQCDYKAKVKGTLTNHVRFKHLQSAV